MMNYISIQSDLTDLTERSQEIRKTNCSDKDFNILYGFFKKHSKPLKIDNCYICGCKIGTDNTHKLCLSHSIPQHSLKHISSNGMINGINQYIHVPAHPEIQGINRSGTFRLICRKCDSSVFSEYEDFNSYNDDFLTEYHLPKNQNILNQIAIKNTLLSLYNELSTKNFLLGALENTEEDSRDTIEHILTPHNAMIQEYEESLLRYKKLMLKKYIIKEYYLGFYRQIPRPTPVAFQGSLNIHQSIDGTIINNPYLKRKLKPLHICIFPDDNRTTLLAFCRSSLSIYNKILNTLNYLADKDVVKMLIALSMMYSDNIRISPEASNQFTSQEMDYLSKLAGFDGTQLTHFQADRPIPPAQLQSLLSRQETETLAAYPPLYTQYNLIPDALTGW